MQPEETDMVCMSVLFHFNLAGMKTLTLQVQRIVVTHNLQGVVD